MRNVLLVVLVVVTLLHAESPLLPKELKFRRGFLRAKTVYQVKPVSGEFECAGISDAIGCADCTNKEITIDVSRDIRSVKVTMRHEVLHVLTSCRDGKVDIHSSIRDFAYKLQEFEEENPDYVKFMNSE